MCGGKGGGLGGLFGGGGLGGLLGGLIGGGLDLAFPEIGVPLSLATGAGGFLGNLAGGGDIKSAALEGAGLGALGGAGNAALGGSFFGAPTGTGISGLFGGGTSAAGDVAGGSAIPVGSDPVAASGATTGATDAVGNLGASAGAGVTDLAGNPLPSSAATGAATPLTTPGAAATAPTTAAGTSTAAAGVPSTTTGATAAGGSTTDATLGSKIMSYIKNNPLAVLSAGAAAYPLLQGNTVPGLSDLKTQAALEGRIGNQEAQALQTGQLPQGAQSALDNAAEAAKATIRGNYASLGLTGSTQEAQALAGVDSGIAAQKFGELKSVTDAGMSAINSSDALLKTIMDTEVSQDAQTSQAIARLAAALAGGGTTKAAAA